ncbi:MAG TPA: AraC family transcriptional regulator [Verrucomicrobiales bacterium]|nr:AraC family transcriptional regulator [Verrucomicrobiales bacterium]
MKSDSNEISRWLEVLELADGAELLFEHLPGCLFYIKDRGGRFVALNEPLATQLGAGSKRDVLGRTDAEFLPEYLVERYHEDDLRVLDHGEVIREKVELLTSADGVVDWFVTTKVPLRNLRGQIVALAGVTREYHGSDGGFTTPDALDAALEHIRAHYAEAIRIGDLGRLMGLSVSAFERKFKKHFRMSPTEYIRRVRVHEACRSLIHTSTPISAIAQECGFSDQSHFTRDFVRVMRTTPAVYRRDHGLA